ncbi:hypothetical protein D3C74_410220 [compost metagenome]
MACWSFRVNLYQQCVAVAVIMNRGNGLGIARGPSLMPQLAARTAPEPGLSALQRELKRFFVHIGKHQDFQTVRILDYRRQQSGFIPADTL